MCVSVSVVSGVYIRASLANSPTRDLTPPHFITEFESRTSS